MNIILRKRKSIIITLLLFLVISNFVISFAYWASSVAGDVEISDASVGVGEWLNGNQIWDTEDFISMLTTNNNTGEYSLAVDLDFENITPASWTQTKDVIFEGTLDCGNKTLSNISLTDYRGLFGVLDGATIKNCVIDGLSIDYTTNDSYTSGLLAGRLQGTSNLIENITILNSSMNNTNVFSGALFGYVSPTSGTGDAVIKDITISNTTVSGAYSNASYGSGGLIGTVNNFDLTMENIDMEVDVTSTSNGNVGGLIGSVIGTSVLSIDDVHIDQSNLEILGTDITLGAGGLIGLMLGTSHDISNINISQSTITSASLSGGLIGYANQASATLELDQIDISDSTISSTVSNASSGAGGIFGVINGYSVDMTNINVSSDITSSSNSNAGGIAAYVTSSSLIDLNGVTIDDSTILINGTGNTLGSGGLIGLLNGDNHTFTNINVTDTNVSSASLSGGLIGYANGSSESIAFDTVTLSTTAVSSSISSTSGGAGGLIGVINGYSVDMLDISVTADITASSDSNAGGFVAVVTSTSSINLDDVSVSDSDITVNGTNTSLGAGGFVGLLNGDGHLFNDIEIINVNVASDSLSGGVIGYSDQSSGTLSIMGVLMSGSTITSSITGETNGVGGMIGSITDSIVDISDANITTLTVSATDETNAGGLIGFVPNSVVVDFEDILIDSSTIQSQSTDNTEGSGGLVGLMYGDGHQFTNIRLIDSNVTSETSAAGMIGRSEQVGATITFDNIKIVGSTIYGGSTSGTSGVGGIIGRNRQTDFVMRDIYIQSTITSNRSNSAGLIGFSRYSALTVTRAVIYSDLIIDNAGSAANRGSAGIIGRNRDDDGSVITDFFFTGYFKARVSGSQTYAGILKIANDNLIYSNVRSAEITYYLAANPNTLVNSSTLYNNMLGQNPTYATTYTTLRSSLNASYWTTNFSNITGSGLWTYNSTTHLYELI